MISNHSLFEVSAVVISFTLIISYHIIYILEVYFEKNEVFNLWINNRISHQWVNKYFDNRSPDLTYQSTYALRNTILIAIFLGKLRIENVSLHHLKTTKSLQDPNTEPQEVTL